jgi:hypothetical protein
MKHLKTYEFFRAKHTNMAYQQDLSGKEIMNAVKRNVRHAKDFITKTDKTTSDRPIFDEKELMKDIHKIIKDFGKLQSFFGHFRFVSGHGSFSGFLYEYHDLVTEFGFYPTNLTEDLIQRILRTNYELADCFSGWISENEKAKKLYYDIDDLAKKIGNVYYNFGEEVSRYNL